MFKKNLDNLVRSNIFKIPSYVPGRSKEEICSEFNIPLAKIIKLASNENALGVPNLIKKKITEKLEDIYLYPEGSGEELRNKLAEIWRLEAANFILGNGTDEVISLVCETFLNPTEEVIIGKPTFSYYEIAVRVMGGKCIFVPLNKYRFNLPGILKKITPKTKLIFICNPNNPTGTIVNKSEAGKFLDSLPEHVIVIFDEAYADYAEDKNFPQSIKYIKDKKIIILRTFSKIYSLAGLRIGYGIASQEIISFLNRVKKPFNINRLAQSAALASLENDKWADKSREMVYEGKKYLYNELEKMGLFFIPSQANFILINVGIKGEIVFNKMLEKGIIIRPTGSFGLPDFIRVTIGKKEQNEKFIKELKKIL